MTRAELLQWFDDKHTMALRRFDTQTSYIALGHVSTRPLRPANDNGSRIASSHSYCYVLSYLWCKLIFETSAPPQFSVLLK